jgi:hypothetical protein
VSDQTVTVEQEFVLDTVGDMEGNTGGSNRDAGGEQTIPPEQWLGEPNYLELEQAQAAKGFFKLLAALFTPQPTVQDMGLTPDDEFAMQETLLQVRDTLRYLGSTSMKVTDVPAKRQKLYTVAVGTTAARIAGFQPNRKKLTIRNLSANTVFLAEDMAGCNSVTGYQLLAITTQGSEITVNAQGEVWAMSAAGGEKLNIQAEYYD